jgi:hypothetical protein
LRQYFDISKDDITKLHQYLASRYEKQYQQQKTGAIPELSVKHAGSLFKFQNRESSITELFGHVYNHYSRFRDGNTGQSESLDKVAVNIPIICGASGIGKTSFVQYFRNRCFDMRTDDADFAATLKRSKNILRLEVDLSTLSKNEDTSKVITSRLLFQIVSSIQLCLEKPVLVWNDFFDTYSDVISQLNLAPVLDMLYEHTEGPLLFILHIDETQFLFRKEHENVLQGFIRTVRGTASRANKYCILPVMSGTNALDTIKEFTHRLTTYRTISLELLETRHLLDIIDSIYDKKMTYGKIFESSIRLLAGHPRLFSFYITIASCFKIGFQHETTPQSVVQDKRSYDNKSIDIPFKKDGFLQFMDFVSNDTFGAAKYWEIMKNVRELVVQELFPELNVSNDLSDPDKNEAREGCILAVLDGTPVKRNDKCTKYTRYGDCEDKGMVFLDRTGRTDGHFNPRSPHIILTSMFSRHLFMLPEPVVSDAVKLDPVQNELQDSATIMNRMRKARKKISTDYVVDLYDVWPDYFSTEEYIVHFPNYKLIHRECAKKIENLKDMHELCDENLMLDHHTVAFTNFNKASFADGFVKFTLYRGSKVYHNHKRFLTLMVEQSKRHEVETTTQDKLALKKYLSHLDAELIPKGIFHGVTAFVDGNNIDYFLDLLKQHGAKVVRAPDAKCTHCICLNGTSSQKYLSANNSNIPCVSSTWITESIKAESLQSEYSYIVGQQNVLAMRRLEQSAQERLQDTLTNNNVVFLFYLSDAPIPNAQKERPYLICVPKNDSTKFYGVHRQELRVLRNSLSINKTKNHRYVLHFCTLHSIRDDKKETW